MAEDNDKRARHRALLKKSYDALEAEQKNPEEESKRRRRDDTSGGGAGSGEIMYRGKAVKKGRGLGTPGAGSGAGRGRQFRGASTQPGRKPGGGGGEGGVKEALKKLTDLHREGLITKAEFDRKKQQLLDRL